MTDTPAPTAAGTTHAPAPTVTRHCDVAVVGGSAGGLAAALQLARQRRSVIVIDSGEPRNAAAEHLHSFLTRDGQPPAQLLEAARAEVRGYGVEVVAGRVVAVTRAEPAHADLTQAALPRARTTQRGERFVLELAAGHTVSARRVIVATGIADELPDITGLADHWGREVIHCPFCHGYEVRDQRIVQLVTHPLALHTAPLFRQLTERLTVLVQPGVEVDQDELGRLTGAGVDVRTVAVHRVVTDEDGRLAALELADGSSLAADAVVVSPRFRPRLEPFAALGLQSEPHRTGLGSVLVADATGATSVEGVYAAGNVTEPSLQLLPAAAQGSQVGGAVAFSLAEEDTREAARPSNGELDWDERYSGERMWSGNPNGSLVVEVAVLPPACALDVGAGEGGDAVWLAEQGWTVTASDISERALDRVRAEASRRGLDITCMAADANGREPFGEAAFDLVSACYASIPRTPDLRSVRTILDAVAPGGSLVVLSHDTEAMRAHRGHDMAFDPDAYVHLDDFAAAVQDNPGWVIDVHEKRARPAGAASSHHVEDVVLRAHRTR
ncbi:MAG: FAD-dependent oxidoreductase [Actinomycetales bacterium]